MKNHLLRVSWLCTLLLMSALHGRSNELLPVSLNERISNSSIIVEGEVISQACFQLGEKGNIYTSNIIRVYKLLKGVLTTTEVEVITHGGTVGNRMQVYSSYLKLAIGETGIFFCTPSTVANRASNARGTTSYMVYSSMQGFIAYDTHLHTASDPFTKYTNLNDALIAVRRVTKMTRVISERVEPINQRKIAGREMAAATITGFAPSSIPAGVGSVLVITGSGFGPATDTSLGACVQFKNGDNGGASWIKPLRPDYVLWTDSEIRVKVPSTSSIYGGSSAGTGKFRVVNTTLDTTESATALTIPYSYTNLRDQMSQIAFMPVHYAMDDLSGGYVFHLENNFAANAGASAAFTRAMQTWVCATGMNWKIGDNTSNDSSTYTDQYNTVRFEIANELPAGVLAVCRSGYNVCSSPFKLVVTDLDVIFDNQGSGGFTWQYGPTPATSGQVDFETVALHELGHGQQLSHVIKAGAVMHYAIGFAQNTRSLSTDDITGGNVVTGNDFAGGFCAPAMEAGDLFVLYTDTTTVCSQGVYNYTLVSGTNVTGNWTRPVVAGISNTAGSGSGNISETLINITASPILVKYIYTLTNGAGCTGVDTAYVTVNPIGNTIAGTAGGAKVCTSQTVAGSGTLFSDATCAAVARVVPSGSSPVAGVINVCTELESAPGSYNGQPYVARHYDIEPATNAATATAIITLYFTQAEFDAYNAANGTYPELPAGSADATGIANLRVTQFHGTSATGLPGSYSGSTEYINPADGSIVYNATAGRWEITFSVTGFSGFFVHTGAVALPLRLIQFGGRTSGTINILSWTTADEAGIQSFTILRSHDGVHFSAAGEVTATGTLDGDKTYAFTDDVSNAPQPVYYYRLQINEVSGQPGLSKVVQLRTDIKQLTMKVLQNPFGQSLQLEVTSPQQQDGTMTLSDMNGRRLSQHNVVIQHGTAVVDVPDVQGLLKGTYVLTLITATGKIVTKVVKQ